MKKLFIVLSLCLPLAINVAKAQKTTAAAKDSAAFMKNFNAIFTLITTATSEADGKASGIIVSAPEYGSYQLKKGQGLSGATEETLSWYEASKKWEYHAEFGRYKPGQEAAQQAMEEKVTKLVQAGIDGTDWQPVKTKPTADAKTRQLLHYNNVKGWHHIRLKVSKRTSGDVIILTWD